MSEIKGNRILMFLKKVGFSDRSMSKKMAFLGFSKISYPEIAYRFTFSFISSYQRRVSNHIPQNSKTFTKTFRWRTETRFL